MPGFVLLPDDVLICFWCEQTSPTQALRPSAHVASPADLAATQHEAIPIGRLFDGIRLTRHGGLLARKLCAMTRHKEIKGRCGSIPAYSFLDCLRRSPKQIHTAIALQTGRFEQNTIARKHITRDEADNITNNKVKNGHLKNALKKHCANNVSQPFLGCRHERH